MIATIITAAFWLVLISFAIGVVYGLIHVLIFGIE